MVAGQHLQLLQLKFLNIHHSPSHLLQNKNGHKEPVLNVEHRREKELIPGICVQCVLLHFALERKKRAGKIFIIDLNQTEEINIEPQNPDPQQLSHK